MNAHIWLWGDHLIACKSSFRVMMQEIVRDWPRKPVPPVLARQGFAEAVRQVAEDRKANPDQFDECVRHVLKSARAYMQSDHAKGGAPYGPRSWGENFGAQGPEIWEAQTTRKYSDILSEMNGDAQ